MVVVRGRAGASSKAPDGTVSATPSSSARRGERIWTQPIKGTRPRGRRAELVASDKDAAEHVMIVDLERNDLSRVCRPGSVRWPQLMAPASLAGVEHLVSTVEGDVRPGVGLAEVLAATFPGGSVTGAPKIAAVDLIAALEPVGRGASMGALGCVHGNGDFELALTIRTFAVAGGRLHLWVGGGIVWDSDPDEEVEESLRRQRCRGHRRPAQRSPRLRPEGGGASVRRPRRCPARRRRSTDAVVSCDDRVRARSCRVRDAARLRRHRIACRASGAPVRFAERFLLPP
jgi:hypothetical protein